MTVGQNIKSIRLKKRIRQKDLADMSGLTVNGLQKIEYGQIQPKSETIHKIAVALGVEDIDLDDNLKEMLQKWNQNIDEIVSESKIFDALPDYDEDDIDIFRSFLSLNPDGKQKASEYIELLMLKYKNK